MIYSRLTIATAVLLNLLLIGTVMSQCSGCTPRPLESPHYATSDPAVVRLHMTNLLGDAGSCTGWKADEDLVVTAGHCCVVSNIAYSADGDHAVLGGTFVPLIVDEQHDVCVLRGRIKGRVIYLASQDPEIGGRVWTAGFPHEMYLISDGFWSGRNYEGNGVSSSVVGKGASGSPIMNAEGEAVGVLIMKFGDMDSLGAIAPLEWVRAAIIRARI